MAQHLLAALLVTTAQDLLTREHVRAQLRASAPDLLMGTVLSPSDSRR